MTAITILPEDSIGYRAVAGNKDLTGRTAGEALHALISKLAESETGTLVIIQNRQADRFFDADQQKRLTELIQLRKQKHLSIQEENELENLVNEELRGVERRAEALLNQLDL